MFHPPALLWLIPSSLTLNFLMAVVNTLNTKTHSSKEMTEFSFENADAVSICYCKQRMKSTLSLSSECDETKLCELCPSFTSHLHSLCGMVWYWTLRVNHKSDVNTLSTTQPSNYIIQCLEFSLLNNTAARHGVRIPLAAGCFRVESYQ